MQITMSSRLRHVPGQKGLVLPAQAERKLPKSPKSPASAVSTEPCARKGATRIADIPADVLDGLSRGTLCTATLSECLAVDQALLLRSVFPDLSPAVYEQAQQAGALGILRRMERIAALLLQALGEGGIATCVAHTADMVRGWGCFMIGVLPDTQGVDLSARLAAIEPLADDAHFGVREWAWMAVRPHLARQLPLAIDLLQPWTDSPSERLRRFACEALRPRGVWCVHIAALKRDPEPMRPLLDALRADPSVYVQDSVAVANWLNDMAKDQPDWVRMLCLQWEKESTSAATRRICKRAQRSFSLGRRY